ncbi:MAG TPA: cytochrome c [Burkholderiales bacterium]|nr:cytochrome c [Burkholderiales bacterium]
MISFRVLTGVVCAALLSATASLQAAEGDPAAGVQKKQMCEGCHGIAGYRTAYPTVYSAPKLGGQSAAYMVKALQDYKSGARQHPSMNGIAASLSEKDMADIAAYYADPNKTASK